jgi:hypothetical protein
MIDPLSRLPLPIDPKARPVASPSKPEEFRALLAALLQRPSESENDRLGALLSDQLRLTLLEALTRKPEPPPLPPPALPFIFDAPPIEAPRQESLPPDDARVIQETAEHAGVDPDFLRALRRVENGGPGREFGVLSVPAPTYHDQARVAAESIRKSLERFRGQGGQPIDPLTGRYSEEFIRFFSSRYAPVGATNDPRGLNRFHAGNLIRLYLTSSDRA